LPIMEIWRVEDVDGRRPSVMSGGNLFRALVLHVLVFAFFFTYACVKGLFAREVEEPIRFIDPTVVVNENLDGVENEPPPLQDPEPPPPPPPKPKTPPKEKKPDPPKELERIVTNVVRKVEKKEEKKEEKAETKEPEKPKKTAKELRDERMKKMRDSAKSVKGKTVTIKVPNAQSGNGKTDKKTLSDAEIMKLLNAGYTPGSSTNLAENELQLAYSHIKKAFEAKWDQPPWTDTLRPMTIRVWFGTGGQVVRWNLEKSSGDRRADQSIISAAARVGYVPTLPKAFIDRFRSSGIPIQFTVKPR